MADQNVLNRQKVLEVAKNTKDAIIAEWERCGENFIDKNYLLKEGIIPHSIGLTSVLLLMVAFSDESKVFTESEIKKINEKVVKMLGKLVEMENKEGFSISPYKTAEETKDLFGKFGYTDTVTWVLSSCILARYAQRKGTLKIQSDLQEKIFALLTKSLSLLLSSQREDGTWGFRADKKASKSLYFTYAANASLADFYNYILGEIENVEKTNDEEKKIGKDEDFVDRELIAYIETNTEIRNVREAMGKARGKLQTWLIEDCLPLLPKISRCEILTDSENKEIGVGSQNSSQANDFNYFNLYYAYYVIDLFIDSAADIRYKEIVKDAEELSTLANKYKNKGFFSKDDWYYFFNPRNIANAQNLCEEYIAQAIHATRTNYLKAARTGAMFWDGNQSELLIEWKHEDEYEVPPAEIVRLGLTIKEPALVPMALRVNTQYSYYISKKEDKVIDDLFDKISKDRYFASADVSNNEKNCVSNLWDDQSYSLPITERSIEAIIDAYDYVLMFEGKGSGGSSGASEIENYFSQLVESQIAKSVKPTIDEKTIEKIVAKKVEEEVAKKLAKVEISAPTPVAVSTSISDEDLIEKIEDVISCLSFTRIPRPNSEEPSERLAHAIMKLSEQTQNSLWYDVVAKQKFLARNSNRDAEEIYKVDDVEFRSYFRNMEGYISSYERKWRLLFSAIIGDIEEKGEDFLMILYNACKGLVSPGDIKNK